MMRIFYTVSFLLLSTMLLAQNSFERIDSIPKTKEQIFSKTKLFITDNWKTLSIIENEDRETGLISIRSSIIVNLCYVYSFRVNFHMKENKYKITIDNIQPQRRICNGTVQYSPTICDGCEFPGSFKAAMYEKEWIKVQQEFPTALNNILKAYDDYLRKESSDW